MSRNLEGRIKYAELGALAPKVQSAMMALSKAVEESGLDHQLLNLVKLRASQINGCAFCIQMHSADARKYGISEERLQLLCVWRETSLYSDRERAALAWCESITLIAEHGMPADLYAQGNAVFSDVEIAHLVSAIVLINSWNRFSIAFHFPPQVPAVATAASH